MKRSLQKGIETYAQASLTVTRGRRFEESSKHFPSLSEWDQDLSRILYSEAMQRISSKMQVWPINNGSGGPIDPHICNRRTHIDLVIIISAIIAKELGLNVRLCEAIAAGHDVGHTPFSHNGERFLKLNHALNGVVILQSVEKGGKGLQDCNESIAGKTGNTDFACRYFASRSGCWS